MNSSVLNWREFDWDHFQTLSIRIAESIVPECNFDEYLKKGQKQDGIDLLGFNKNDGSFFCIQCKKVNELSLADLDNIVKEFLAGEYGKKSTQFVITTSADLQSSKLQIGINNLRAHLFQNHNLIFECWDLKFIEKKLKDIWQVVEYYFGEEQAINFCYPQLRDTQLQKIQPIDNFIPRKITPFNTIGIFLPGK